MLMESRYRNDAAMPISDSLAWLLAGQEPLKSQAYLVRQHRSNTSIGKHYL